VSVQPYTTPAGDRRYRVRWTEEGRKRSKSFSRMAAARAFDGEIRDAVRRRRELGAFAPQEPSTMTVADFLDKAWSERAVGWEENTRKARGDALDTWVVPLLGRVPLNECSRPRLRRFRAQMVEDGVPRRDGVRGRRKATASRANTVMRILSAFLGFAVEDGLIPHNPCRGIRPMPHLASKHRAWDPVVIERLRAELSHRDRVIVSLMYLAGLRPQEALAIEWRHVQSRTLLVEQAAAEGKIKRTKAGTAKAVELQPILREDLEEWRLACGSPIDGLVCPSGRAGGVLHLRGWRKNVWHSARLRAGLPPMTPYDCRHTFGSLLIHEGRDVLVVARLMRHATATTTLDHYAHEFAEWQDRERQPLEQIVREARAEVAAALAAKRPDDEGGGHAAPTSDDEPRPGGPGGGDAGASFEPAHAEQPTRAGLPSPAGGETLTIDEPGTQADTEGAADVPPPTTPSDRTPTAGTIFGPSDAATGTPATAQNTDGPAVSGLHHPAAHAHAAHGCQARTGRRGMRPNAGVSERQHSTSHPSDAPVSPPQGPRKDHRGGLDLRRAPLAAAAARRAPRPTAAAPEPPAPRGPRSPRDLRAATLTTAARRLAGAR